MFRLRIIYLLTLFICGASAFGQTINARITPVISVNNDSLYLDIEVTRSGMATFPLGNSDFAFRITDSRTSVPGLSSPIDLAGITIKSRGRWDATADTNYLPIAFDKSVDNSTFILKVRTKTPRSLATLSNSTIVQSNFGPTSLVARLATKIEAGACLDSIKLEWNRNISNAAPVGYLNAYTFNITNSTYGNSFIPVSGNNYIKLRPSITAPFVGAASLPQAVLFTWYSVPNVRRYFARIVKNGGAETTFVNIGSGDVTEYRVQTRPRDTVCFTLFAKSSCGLDSVTSGISCGTALECPILTLEPANVTLNKNTPYCPTELVTITIDTAGKNLTRPARFSFDNGLTFTGSNTFSFRGTRDTTLRVTYQDGDFCPANTTITVNVPILRLTQANTSIAMNLVDSICNSSNVSLAYTPTGDNLIYTWTTSGAGTFVDAAGAALPTPVIGTPIFYRPAPGETGVINFRAFNDCFGIGANDNVKLLAQPDAAVLADPTQLQGNSFPTNSPIRFSRTTPVAGEIYDYVFSDNLGNVLDTNASTITRTFSTGGTYRITLTVTNGSGCVDTASQTFRVVENFNVYLPNVFSPAATNPLDQTFRINGTGVQEAIELIVFDRWGKEVYTESNFTRAKNVGWNGKKDNTGELQQTGTYSYVIRGKFVNNNNFEKSGTVTLIR